MCGTCGLCSVALCSYVAVKGENCNYCIDNNVKNSTLTSLLASALLTDISFALLGFLLGLQWPCLVIAACINMEIM